MKYFPARLSWTESKTTIIQGLFSVIIVITIEGSERICGARTVIVIMGIFGASSQMNEPQALT